MPRQEVTVYDSLLSCPSDVEDLKPIVEECISIFNKNFGQQTAILNLVVNHKNYLMGFSYMNVMLVLLYLETDLEHLLINGLLVLRKK